MVTKNIASIWLAATLSPYLVLTATAMAHETIQSDRLAAEANKPEMARLVNLSGNMIDALMLNIPATKMELDNGLTLVVHEDHSQPLVAVNITYHVGSKDEQMGKSGFAHLFEHLMFNGSENYDDDFFMATRLIGATDQNGTTSSDLTNYYQTVPKKALDTILWLESDRMGHLLGAIDQAKLDEQRAVVKNEKRESENAPYAKAWDLILRATTPVDHPYGHSVIGSMEDLDAANLDDVKAWFRAYYGPSNAVLVLAGDITPDEARQKVEAYFGDIPPGEPIARPTSWPASMSQPVRETLEDRVANPQIQRFWNIPSATSPASTYLGLVGEILAGGQNSRLYKRLVKKEGLASNVWYILDEGEIGGRFGIFVDVENDADMDAIERILSEELALLVATGPSNEEMALVRARTFSDVARTLESISRKAELLAESTILRGTPDGWKTDVVLIKGAQPSDIEHAASTWLTKPDYTLRIVPFGQYTTTETEVDRSAMPMPESIAPARFPDIERATLDNGMELLVAHRADAPAILFKMQFDTGADADWRRENPVVAHVALSMLDAGTQTRTAEDISHTFELMGATFNSEGGNEVGWASLAAFDSNLRDSLSLFYEVLASPSYPQQEIDRIKALRLASLAQSRVDPDATAYYLLPSLIYGEDSLAGRLVSEAMIRALDREALQAFHARWIHPNNATLVVTGDTTLAEIRPEIEAVFGSWKRAEVPQIIESEERAQDAARVYLVDRPGSQQSVIRAGVLARPYLQGDEPARRIFNMAFGDAFTSRLNMKLREEKGWAYGAGSGFSQSRGPRIFSIVTSVQTDKTAASLEEIASLVYDVVSQRKIDAGELKAAKDEIMLGLTSDWSTSDGLAEQIAMQAAYGLPDDYARHYPQAIESVGIEEINAAAADVLNDKPLTWLIVGDRAKIEDSVRALELGTFQVINAEGKAVP